MDRSVAGSGPASCRASRRRARRRGRRIVHRIHGRRAYEPRLTRDVDVSLFTGFGAEEATARALLELFEPRIHDALEFAVVNRVLLLQGSGGVPELKGESGILPELDRVRAETAAGG